jgi:hypothetical protein
MIVTYTALLSLAILRDDFKRLDRRSLVTFLKSSQREDGRCVRAFIVILSPDWIKVLPQSQQEATRICV